MSDGEKSAWGFLFIVVLMIPVFKAVFIIFYMSYLFETGDADLYGGLILSNLVWVFVFSILAVGIKNSIIDEM